MTNAHEPSVMLAAPDRASATPVYRQIADSVKYGIATGCFETGERLPKVDSAAREWGVNLHTVRQAYGTLAEEGLVQVQRRLGVRVCGQAFLSKPDMPSLDAFLTRITNEAHAAYGLRPDELAELIRGRRVETRQRGAVAVVECTEDQVAHHAEELLNAFNLEVAGTCLSGVGEPLPGPICSTYFHAREVAARWPGRQDDIVLVGIEPSHEIADQIRDARGQVPRIVLHETNAMRASLIEGQLRGIPGLRDADILTAIVRSINEFPDAVHLFTPRHWAKLSPELQARENTYELPYRIKTRELERIAPLFDAVH